MSSISSEKDSNFVSNEKGKLYVRPLGIVHGCRVKEIVNSGRGLPLTESGAFTSCQMIVRDKKGERVDELAVTSLTDWQKKNGTYLSRLLEKIVGRIGNTRQTIVGQSLSNPLIVGIVNITPDSFSDGGEYQTVDRAIARGRELFEAGAALIDVGGESTRPGANPVSADVEQRRVIPVVSALAGEGIPVSIDTYHPETMLAAVKNGARVINDVTALTADCRSLQTSSSTGAIIVLMHSQTLSGGTERFLGRKTPIDVYDYLEDRINVAATSGIPRDRIIVDPGLGFMSNPDDNFQILQWLSLYHGLGCPVMVGASRKFGRLDAGLLPQGRIGGSLAAALHAVDNGVQLIRVHDIAETKQALGVWRAIRGMAW